MLLNTLYESRFVYLFVRLPPPWLCGIIIAGVTQGSVWLSTRIPTAHLATIKTVKMDVENVTC